MIVGDWRYEPSEEYDDRSKWQRWLAQRRKATITRGLVRGVLQSFQTKPKRWISDPHIMFAAGISFDSSPNSIHHEVAVAHRNMVILIRIGGGGYFLPNVLDRWRLRRAIAQFTKRYPEQVEPGNGSGKR